MATAPSDVNRPNPAVFLQDFVDVARTGAGVSRRIAGGDWWLDHLASTASSDTETQLMRIGPASFGDWVAREVRVRIGRATATGDSTLVPLRWEDARRPHLFPVLDGNLEVVPLGPDSCRVVLSATYRPPFEGVGQLLDHAFLHRVAESTVRSFLTQLARSLEADLSSGADGVRADGVRADGVGADGVGADGVGADGVGEAAPHPGVPDVPPHRLYPLS